MSQPERCSNCYRQIETSLVWSGYSTPMPDVAPAYHEWDELWLCMECIEELKLPDGGDRRLYSEVEAYEAEAEEIAEHSKGGGK